MDKDLKEYKIQQTIKFQENLLQASIDGILIIDASQNIIVANKAFCEIFNETRENLIETNLFVWLAQLDNNAINQWAKIEKNVYVKGKTQNVEFNKITNTEIKYYSVNASILEQISTEERGVIISIWRDITERKEAEQKLIESEGKMRLLLENSPDFISIIDHNGYFKYVNRILPDLTKEEINQKSLYDFLLPEFRGKFKEKLDIAYQKNKSTTLQTKGFGQGGNVSWYENRIIPLIQDGKVNEIILITTDITKLKETEVFLRKFISSVSHELRTPITVLLQAQANLNKYKDKISEEDRIKLTESISRNIKLISILVEEILITARVDEEKVKWAWQEYKPINLINNILEMIEPQREKKGITVEIKVDREIILFGDIKIISQLFRILIDNAIKFSYTNSKIIIKAINQYKGMFNLQGLDGVLFQFIDFGIVIPKDKLPKLFQRFYSVSSAENISRTGLKFCIAKDLTSIHNGNIFVESIIKKGTTFSVFLPRLEKPLENKNK